MLPDNRQKEDDMKWKLSFIALAIISYAAHANPVVSLGSGAVFKAGFPKYDQDTATGKWTVEIDVTETGTCCGFFVFLDATSTVVIEELIITGSGPYTTSWMHLVVRADNPSGSITSVESVNYIDPGFGLNPLDLVLTIDLDDVGGTGRIGNGVDGTPTTIEAHRINRIKARSIEASIVTFAGGDINEIDINGDIGKTASHATINSGGDIIDIKAKNIYADIDAVDNVESIRAFGSGSDTVEATDGVIDGSIDCDTMNNGLGIRVWGDLDADVTVADEMVGTTARMFVGRELAGNVDIGASGVGVRGITIGWMPSATGGWSGDISVGGVALTPKGDYTQTGLGGGAVGLVPYGLHKQDCVPAYVGSTWPTEDYVLDCTKSPLDEQPVSVTLRHYGVVENSIVPSGEKPFEVFWSTGNHCVGTCIHGTLNDVTDDWDLVSVSDAR